ncbi:hypothetical protein D9615_009126 [Tricholomella constricta]|uniref:Uncharacterized protein n=1 Tax=Tricholomella constricta TaxID=117010 RepID=A0A8H5LYQ6_9AGAR|nr:hypothetical protein D9615_009126 [Tricholomella constricta]
MNTDTHWSSYSFHGGPGRSRAVCTGCIISVVLDAGARDRFGAIRLLIVKKETVKLRSVTLKDCPDYQRHNCTSPSTRVLGNLIPTVAFPPNHPRFRTILSNFRNGRQHNQDLLQSYTPRRPICTVLLELVDASHGESPESEVVTILPYQTGPEPFTTPWLQVIYEYIHACDPTNPSFLVLLDCNTPFDTRHLGLPSAHGIPLHSIGIMSTATRPCYNPLPHKLICRIVKLALMHKHSRWRSELLAYGLVCKSWMHVLDLFFEHIGGVYDLDKPYIHRVARSLQIKPKHATVMKTFYSSDFRPHESNRTIADWHDLLTILGLATSVTAVWLQPFPQGVAGLIVQTLSTLRQVRSLALKSGGSGAIFLSITEIQVAIAQWQDLKVLRLQEWTQKNSDIALYPHSLACKVETLDLHSGTLTSSQLMSFVTSPTLPHLHTLNLSNVQGLSNHGFFMFLSSIASTLTELAITNCSIPCSSPEEELALDAAMPTLDALHILTVDAAHVTALAVSRKGGQAGPGPDDLENRSSITIAFASVDLLLGPLEHAIGVTGWQSVFIAWSSDPLGSDVHLIQRVLNAAAKRNIHLETV